MRAALILSLMALGGCAGDAAQRAASPAAAPTSLEAAVARLPASVAEFTRGEVTWHERERPGLGVAADYAGPGRAAVATVSLYDRGGGPIADDPTAPRMRAEFESAVADAVASAGRRTSAQLTDRETTILPVPGGAALNCARLDGTYGRQEVRTLVCLGAASGRFMKVQVTSPARPVRAVDPVPFVIGVTQAARGQSG
jgi:hypothetical protein